MEFKIEGLDEMINDLDKSSNNVKSESKKLIKRVGMKLKSRTILKTPVAEKDGGTLRRSWQFRVSSDFEGILSNNVHYAPHVEFGFRTRQGKGGKSSNPKYKYKPKSGGKTFVDGRYMLTKSVQETEQELENELEILIENLWK